MTGKSEPDVIVVGLDGSDGGRRALTFALREARLRHCAVEAVWVARTADDVALSDYELWDADTPDSDHQVCRSCIEHSRFGSSATARSHVMKAWQSPNEIVETPRRPYVVTACRVE
ncbi:MAG: universal stress protein [Kribbellaceae bacterium]